MLALWEAALKALFHEGLLSHSYGCLDALNWPKSVPFGVILTLGNSQKFPVTSLMLRCTGTQCNIFTALPFGTWQQYSLHF